MTTDRWVGVHTGGPHYLDHLGILCESLKIPLLVTELETFRVAKEYYPDLDVRYTELANLTLEYLSEVADVIFESGHTFAAELIPLWQVMHGKRMRVVYCPHGNSDKKAPHLMKDISLIYGDHMHDHLLRTGENDFIENIVVTGNYRAAYYYAKKDWFDHKLSQELDHHLDPAKKTILYAPTWDQNDWYLQTVQVVAELASEYNLVVRLHPFLSELYPVENEKIQALGAIHFSSFPSVYPLLNRCDFYLGDRSSIGYDFLCFDKPLFFIGEGDGEIYQCGLTLHSKICEAIAQFQDSSELSRKRKQLSHRVFGKNKNFDAIKAEIKKALEISRALRMSSEN